MGLKDRATSHSKLALSLGAATIVALAAMFAAEAKAQTSGESLSNLEARVEFIVFLSLCFASSGE